METVLQDVRYSLRVLAKSPGFTVVAVLILALGIGANTTIFSVVNALLFKPLPYKDADRIVYVFEGKERVQNWGAVSGADFEDWKNQNQVFAEMALFSPDSVNVAGGGEPERVAAIRVSKEMIPLLGIKPMLGRPFTNDEYAPRTQSVLLGHGMWTRRFGSARNVVGRSMQIDGLPHIVAGVLPPNLKLGMITGSEPEVMLPLLPNVSASRALRNFGAFARLRSGVSIERARNDMALIARRLQQQYPDTNAGWTTYVDTLRGSVDPVAYVLLVVLICSVLGIACANVINLLMARATARRREICLRSALGATRGRIIRQLVTESMMLAFAGCCLGVLVSYWACGLIGAAGAGSNAGLLDISIDRRVLLGSLVLFALTGIAIGLLPALQASSGELNQPLKEGASTTQASSSKRRVTNILVISEIAVSLLLLTGAGLVIKSWLRMWTMDLGFQHRGVLTMSLALSKTEYPRENSQIAFYRQLLSRLDARSDIQSAAVTSAFPTRAPITPFTIEGRSQPAATEEPAARFSAASPNYFSTLAIPLRQGRSFSEADDANSLPVAIVSEAAARKYWTGQDPLGSQVRIAGKLRTIVGVAGDVKSIPLSIRPYPDIYVPWPQAAGTGIVILARTAARNPLDAAATVKAEIRSINPDQPASGVRTMEEAMSSNMGVIKLGTSLLTILAFGALVLAAAGIYGVLSYAVSRRSGEIGIRMAVGASRAKVLQMVLRQGMILVMSGVAPGLAASLALGRVLSNRIHGVNSTEPAIMAGAIVTLAFVSLGACYIPARRATHIDPIRALRSE